LKDWSWPCRGINEGGVEEEARREGRSILTKPFDGEEFRKYGHQMVDFIADYHRDIETFPVRSQVKVYISLAMLIINILELYNSFKGGVLTSFQ